MEILGFKFNIRLFRDSFWGMFMELLFITLFIALAFGIVWSIQTLIK